VFCYLFGCVVAIVLIVELGEPWMNINGSSSMN
jgi:hypothetical protein